jgi:cell division septum initiation protein DivIVA
MRVDDAGYSTYTPPPPPPPSNPPPADAHTSASTSSDKTPQNITQPTQANSAPPTPAQTVDLAAAHYKAAVASGDQDAIKKAQQDVNTAVKNEIGPQVDAANRSVPPEYRTLIEQQVTSYGNVILRRNPSDETTQTALKAAVQDYQIQRKADDLIPQFYGNFTPKEKLDSLKANLQGQSPEVVARAMQDPSVQKMLQDGAKWVDEPYKGVSASDAKENQQAALDASQRLADLTSGLPPDSAKTLVQQSMPTIQKIAGVDANYSGSGAFTSLSKVADSLGDGADAQNLTKQIAQAYGDQFNTWEGRFDDPNGGIVKYTVGSGSSPTLSVALASELKAQGKNDQAGAVLRSVERGVEDQQGKVKKDIEEYNELTKDLNWVVSHSKGKLDAPALQKAIDKYIANQPKDWQDKLQDVENRMMADGKTLGADIGTLNNVPEDLKKLAPDAFANLEKNVGENEDTQSALKWVADRDPSLFAGAKGEGLMGFIVEELHKGKDVDEEFAKSYIKGHVMPVVMNFNQNDPASVAKADQVLSDLRKHASGMLGLPQEEVDRNINKLRDIVRTLQTTKSNATALENIYDLDGTRKKLGELEEITKQSGPAGLTFRVLGLALSGAALVNSTSEEIENPSLSKTFNTMASAVGLGSDTVKLGVAIDAIDKSSTLAKLAMKPAEKLFGALNIAYFTAAAYEDRNNTPVMALDLTGAAGATLATIGEWMGAGAWSGPIGWGVTVLAAGGVELVKHGQELREQTELAEKFLKDGGLDEEVARTLSTDQLGDASRLQTLDLSPKQLQDLAEKHPELFSAGQGGAQSVVDVAKANGIKGEDVEGFLDAVSKDNPNYMQLFTAQQMNNDGAHPLSHAGSLFSIVQSMPTASAFVKENSPALVGADADARRKADAGYEYSMNRSPENVAGLLAGNHDPAYQAEIINIMQNNGTLDNFVQAMGTSYHYNGWPEAARSAIQNAAGAGVITQTQAQSFLQRVG